MIKSIQLENFKAFKDEANMNLNKINIFVGPNSSGKSSFIKALLLLKNTMDSTKYNNVLSMNDEIGFFKNIVYQNNTNNRIKYKLELEDKETIHRYKMTDTMFKIVTILQNIESEEKNLNKFLVILNKQSRENIITSIEFSIKMTKGKKVVIEEFIINYKHNKILKVEMHGNSYYLYINDEKINIPNIVIPYKFYFRINEKKLNNKIQYEELMNIALFESSIYSIEDKLSNFTNNIRYIEPLRNKFKRVEHVTRTNGYDTVGNRGEETISTIVNLQKDKNRVLDKINVWLDRFDLGDSIDIQTLGEDLYSLIVKNKYTGVKCNIIDVGVGTSQLLPIVIESIISPKKSMLIIEEPESHIHPKAQSKLADLIVNISNEDEKKFLIESHSIFLISQIQILIAKKEIRSEDVGIYYFDQNSSGTKVSKMEILENGQFKNEWPTGFFDAQMKLGKTLFKYM